ncbi:AMMECR1 domain-containing protein [Sulfuricella denitrificans skB26]|uniref:AMMECR1 domain-containing protein n=1 Tax=Sulfuricella denitrificans (strain DSM 22764 / NBRC 105220 / skB26) TaxID=1163617 RepID=S6ALK5_SULDS|nr:AmmeMemoRadiSam system protein A [Sulfuricella denitrificans]BAN35574.1 AMMECR1 domain-containing protein [Sulfuricella denitrificans skB26]
MSIEKGRILIPIARSTISRALGREMQANEDAEWLRELGACFVTLTQHGDLRGCIGSLEAHRPLLDDVKANAYAAAFRDTRFSPLSLAELDYTEIEISLLSTMQPMIFHDEIDALAQLRPGVDGVVFECAGRRSTFLPQVWEQLPECGIFMTHLKRKAGLPPDFWAPDVKLARYTVNKWKESELK